MNGELIKYARLHAEQNDKNESNESFDESTDNLDSIADEKFDGSIDKQSSDKKWTNSDQLLNDKITSYSKFVDESKGLIDEEVIEQRNEREKKIKRNLHNQKTYYDQKNNLDSDEISDIQSNIGSLDKLSSLDEKMTEMIKMFIQSFVPFNLIHGSYFSNLLRNTFNIRKMPKLVQMRNFFDIIHELGYKYISQTIGGAESYTLIFEFWKTANRRHQYLTVRAAYIDVFVQRTPVLTCFKVFHDWSVETYMDKFNFIFERYNLQRYKVFACVTNFKARNFLDAISLYGIGMDKVIICLIHQLNSKFNDLFLKCDYEEDKIHYEEKLKEVFIENKEQQNENFNSNIKENHSFSDFESDKNNENINEIDENINKSDEDISESESDENTYVTSEDIDKIYHKNRKMEIRKMVEKQGYILLTPDVSENEDDFKTKYGFEENEIDFEKDDGLAYVKLIEEPKDVFRILNKQKLNKKPATVRVIKEMIKTFAFISSHQHLLDELNNLTSPKNGHEFYTFYLIAYKNWNYLHQFLFYFKMVKDDVIKFLADHQEIPFNLNDDDFNIIDDLFDILAHLVKKMNELSLEENISLGKSLGIMKNFIDSFKFDFRTEEGEHLANLFLDFFKSKHRVFERCFHYGVASLLDPKSTKYDFQSEKEYKNALTNLHDVLCYRLNKIHDQAAFRIREPLRIEIESFLKYRPYKNENDVTKFQLNSPVFQRLIYDFYTATAICFEPKKIDFEVREKIIDCLSQIRYDTLSKIMLLNSLDSDVFDKIIYHAKFW